MYDAPITSVYRVNVAGFDYRNNHAFHARVNVKASSPSKATEWLLRHPWAAHLPTHTSLEVTHAYKLRKQPKVWLRKAGTDGFRFHVIQLIEWVSCPNRR
jgi:hypothetical protein